MTGAIIMLEGLDATGKSSTATAVYNAMPAPLAVLHAGPPLVTTAIREYVWPLGIASAGYVVICDRWHLGEMVWPMVFDREPLIHDKGELRHIEENMMYLSVPILTLYLNRDFHHIEIELFGRGHPSGHLVKANDMYADAMHMSGFDWQNTDLKHAPTLIEEWLDDVRNR